jgi:hypothetical protein
MAEYHNNWLLNAVKLSQAGEENHRYRNMTFSTRSIRVWARANHTPPCCPTSHHLGQGSSPVASVPQPPRLCHGLLNPRLIVPTGTSDVTGSQLRLPWKPETLTFSQPFPSPNSLSSFFDLTKNFGLLCQGASLCLTSTFANIQSSQSSPAQSSTVEHRPAQATL